LAGRYDVVIIGAGPAGIFCALELVGSGKPVRAAVVEKGPPLENRSCPQQVHRSGCQRCSPCRLLSGWGGAGAYSDGKLTLSAEIGGWLKDYVGGDALDGLIDYVDDVYRSYGAPEKAYYCDGDELKEFQRRAARAGLLLMPSRVRHLGTERCAEILEKMRDRLGEKVDVLTEKEAVRILTRDGRAVGVKLAGGEELRADSVVCAPGREGASWFAGEAERLGIKLERNPVDIGLRVELPAVVVDDLASRLYEPKLVYYSPTFDDQVRTFCMCPGGEVVVENNDGLLTVNGHSYAGKKTPLTNFALLVSKGFTEPFREPITYGRNIAGLANMLGGVLVQRLGDLLSGRRSTGKRIAKGLVQPTLAGATPGDVSLVMPYRHLTSILEMLQALDVMAPGVYSRHTLLYAVEVKFYSARPELTGALETAVRGLFAAGDGAGVTRGLVQASASGVHVARQLLGRLGARA